MTNAIRRYTSTIEALLMALLPCIPLFHLNSSFYIDWANHLWMMGYQAAFVFYHRSFPYFFNTTEFVGIPSPIFYGTGFYPLTTLLGVIFTSQLTIRLLVYCFYFIQYRLLIAFFLKNKSPLWLGRSIAIIVTLSIYPLTNLYNRSALTEFFATGFITLCLTSLFLMSSVVTQYERVRWFGWSLLFFVVAFLTHAITAVYGSLFFVAVLPAFFLILNRQSKWIIKYAVIGVMLLTPLALPWITPTFIYGKKLDISYRSSLVVYFRDSIDSIESRLAPSPFDSRTFNESPKTVSTPFLDAPVNVYLLGILPFLLFVFYRNSKNVELNRQGLCWFLYSFLVFGALFYCSVAPKSLNRLPSFFRYIQYSYRLVTYLNLSLIAAMFGLFYNYRDVEILKGDQARRDKGLVAVNFFLGMAVCGFFQKLVHVDAIQVRDGPNAIFYAAGSRDQLLKLPSSYYGLADYSIPDIFQKLDEPREHLNDSVPLVFQPQGGSNFGSIESLNAEVPENAWYQTNVLTFPWTKITLNGSILPDSEIRISNKERPYNRLMTIRLNKGMNQLGVKFEIPAFMQYLRFSVAVYALVLMTVFLTYLTVYSPLWRRRIA